jgi:hypothetical protein
VHISCFLPVSFISSSWFIHPANVRLKLQSVMPCDVASPYLVSCFNTFIQSSPLQACDEEQRAWNKKSSSPWSCLSSEEATGLGQRRRKVVCSTYPWYRECQQDRTETPFSKTDKSTKTRGRWTRLGLADTQRRLKGSSSRIFFQRTPGGEVLGFPEGVKIFRLQHAY